MKYITKFTDVVSAKNAILSAPQVCIVSDGTNSQLLTTGVLFPKDTKLKIYGDTVGNLSFAESINTNLPDIPFDEIPVNEIWYKSADEQIVTGWDIASESTIVSNTYSNGMGKVVLSDALTSFIYSREDSNTSSGCLLSENVTEIYFPKSEFILGPDSLRELDNLEFVHLGGCTYIDSFALKGNPMLLSIIMTKVTDIKRWAFGNCVSLKEICIPDSCTYVGPYAFAKCLLLKKVTCGSSLSYIGDNAFDSCSQLEEINLPHSLKELGEDVFRRCYSLKEVYLPEISYPDSGDGLFYSSGLKKVTAAVVPDDAFILCYTLSNVALLDSVTSIGDDAFRECSSLTSIVIPNSVTSIGKQAFYECSSLTSVTIGNSVTSIGYSAFEDCSSLTSIVIPNSVTSIGERAFYDCSSLTSVTISNSVTWIGDYAFRYCPSLTSINVDANNANYCSVDGVLFDKNKTTLIQYPVGNTRIEYIIPNSVTSIGERAFYDCDDLTSVIIGNSVTSIGGSAFYYCTSLTSITIPNSVTSIGGDAFSHCSSLTSITIPNSVTSIGSYAFYYCKSLTSITIPNSVTSIGNQVFSGCSSLTSVTINRTSPPAILSNTFYAFPGYIYVPASAVNTYKSATNWSTYASKIKAIL